MRYVTLAAAAFALIVPALASAPVYAQATRTWVSGAGDDGETCSRTTPCRSFSAALSKTSAFGEINCLDIGNFGFGPVNITKSITISCESGTANLSAGAGAPGFVINTTTTDIVTLRGLKIEGNVTGQTGIYFKGGGALIVDDVRINGFRGNGGSGGLGIDFSPQSPATLTITNTSITGNGSTSLGSGGGVLITTNGSGASARAFLDNVTIATNFVGLGVVSSGPYVTAQIMNSKIVNNTGIGIVQSGSATVRVSRSAVANNLGASNTGTVLSFLDNEIVANASDVSPPSAGGYK